MEPLRFPPSEAHLWADPRKLFLSDLSKRAEVGALHGKAGELTQIPETLIVERRDAVEWITLNRPHRLNAISPRMVNELADRLALLEADESVRVIVLRGEGRAFCAGLDVKEQLDGTGHEDMSRLPEIILRMRSCPQPIIALVQGPACGGGLAFALAADVRIAGESARFNDAFVNLGLSGCELGLSYFLPRQVGLSVAAELMYTGRFLTAARAHMTGLISEVVPDNQLEAAGEQLVSDMLRLAPIALRMTKQTLARVIGNDDLEEVMGIEMQTQAECMNHVDFGASLRSVLDKRSPRVAPLPRVRRSDPQCTT